MAICLARGLEAQLEARRDLAKRGGKRWFRQEPYSKYLRSCGGSTGGVALFPSGVDPSITLRGAIPLSGAVRLYQVLFRDETSFCTPSTINLSNALRVTWLP